MHDDYDNPYEENEAFYERQPQATDEIEVEFVGGPYDGHRQVAPRHVLLRQICIPVSADAIEGRPGKAPVTSLALYQIYPLEEGLRYLYCESISRQH